MSSGPAPIIGSSGSFFFSMVYLVFLSDFSTTTEVTKKKSDGIPGPVKLVAQLLLELSSLVFGPARYCKSRPALFTCHFSKFP